MSKIASDDLYDKREEQLGAPFMRQIEKFVMLSVVDNLWTNHLDAIDNLRGGIGLRGYAQRDPLVEYKNEAFRMFEQLVFAVDDEIVHRIYKIQVQPPAGSAQRQCAIPASSCLGWECPLRTGTFRRDFIHMRTTAQYQQVQLILKSQFPLHNRRKW